MKHTNTLAAILLILLSPLPCFAAGKTEKREAPPPAETAAREQEPSAPEIIETRAVLLAAGDNLIHDIIYLGQMTPQNASDPNKADFDFTSVYEHIKPLVEKADIAFVNQETPLGGKELGLSNYPSFNTPQEVGRALANAGFDVVNLASNHTMDKGEKAMTATLDFFDALNAEREAEGKEPLATLGIFRSEEDRASRRSLVERNGIVFGFLSYAYGLNGRTLPADKPWLIPLIDDDAMAKEIDSLRPLCDVLVVSMHWGVEFSHEPSARQRSLASLMAAHKADIILGHHPHVTQPCEIIERDDGGKTVIYYSLGDFLSHTQSGTTPDTMLGALAYVAVAKSVEKNSAGEITASVTAIVEAAAIPTVSHYRKGRRPPFTVRALWDYTDELAAEHYKSAAISLDSLWQTSRDIFGMRLLEKNPFEEAEIEAGITNR